MLNKLWNEMVRLVRSLVRNWWWTVIAALILSGQTEAWWWKPLGFLTFLGAVGAAVWCMYDCNRDIENEFIKDEQPTREYPYLQIRTARK